MRKLLTSSIVLVAVLAGCAATSTSVEQPVEQPADSSVSPPRLKPEVLEVLPHDPSAFTQGLEFVGATLYEGTGLTGRSLVQAGPPGKAPSVRAALPPELFGEGLTVVGPTLWQLTWQNGFAIERDASTLAERRRVPYSGEGWGLCHQQGTDRLIMSNGSDKLTFRDPRTFAETGGVTVHSGAQTFRELNELECVGDEVYANVWQTDTILRIDAATGEVTATIDAAGLLSADEKGSADVLNGIAAVPGTDQLLLTGKLWPKMFKVRLVPAP